MSKIFIISGHPDLQKSTANHKIIKVLTKNLNADVLDIASKYPDFKINVKQEQETILNYDTLFFQYPIY